MKINIIKTVFTLFFVAVLVFSAVPLTVLAQETNVITTRSEFEKALNSAKDGDVILVGDMDFNQEGNGAINEAERITLEKSITIKSGKSDGNAIFKGASFLLNGTNVSGMETKISFEEITFDEGLNADEITHTDWDLSYFGDGRLVSNTPLKCQYAISCVGNVNAAFTDCVFKNYMSVKGGAINAWYFDGDNSHCKLIIALDGCSFEKNSALNAGGAIYLYAKNNITISAENCVFDGNRSGFHDQSTGGGAVALFGCNGQFLDCTFKNNVANHFYGGDRFFDFGYVPEMGGNFILYDDNIAGGAVFARDGELSVKNCILTGNSASYGGAIALQTITADVSECIITENKAVSVLEEEYKNRKLGAASCNGIGGAIYIDGAKNITIGNTEIANNYADSAYGAIYATYVTYDPTFYEQFSLNLLFCSIRNNSCGVKISEIENNSGSWLYDTHAIPYIDTFGCLVLDEIYGEDIPRNEQPTAENGYNFFGSTVPEEWYNNEGHLVHAPAVSTAFVKEKLGDRNYYGNFTVGANNHDVTYNFFTDGEIKHSVTISSGVSPEFPVIEKVGYTLSGWEMCDDFDYQTDKPFIVGNETESVDICAIFTPNVYNVTFDFGESTTVIAQAYDSPLMLPETQDRYGYTFQGWFVSEDGEGDPLTDGTIFLHTGDITYHAVYNKNFPIGVVLSVLFAVLMTGGLIALALVVFRHKKHTPAIVPVQPEVHRTPTETKIVKTRYTDEEIDRTIHSTKEAQLLTDRELEVFRELLKGRKQSEIGYYLGITVPTVKDNAGRIYSKFGVSNKSELFDFIDSKSNQNK